MVRAGGAGRGAGCRVADGGCCAPVLDAGAGAGRCRARLLGAEPATSPSVRPAQKPHTTSKRATAMGEVARCRQGSLGGGCWAVGAGRARGAGCRRRARGGCWAVGAGRRARGGRGAPGAGRRAGAVRGGRWTTYPAVRQAQKPHTIGKRATAMGEVARCRQGWSGAGRGAGRRAAGVARRAAGDACRAAGGGRGPGSGRSTGGLVALRTPGQHVDRVRQHFGLEFAAQVRPILPITGKSDKPEHFGDLPVVHAPLPNLRRAGYRIESPVDDGPTELLDDREDMYRASARGYFVFHSKSSPVRRLRKPWTSQRSYRPGPSL